MSGILSYALSLDSTGFTSPLAGASSHLGKFQAATASSSGGLAGLVGGVAVAGAALAGLKVAVMGATAVLEGYAEFDGLVRGLKTIEGTAAATTARLQAMREVAKLPGLGFEEAIRGDIKLRAVGLSAELSEKALRSFGNALATVGGGKDDLNGVILALSQMAAKGKISAEEINQMSERVPQVRAAMKAAFGTADTEALGKSGMTAVEFITRLTDQLGKLPAVTGGARNALDNYADAWKALKNTASEFILSASTGLLGDMSKAFNVTRRALEDLKKSMGMSTPGLEGKDGVTESARAAKEKAQAATTAAATAAKAQRDLEDANFIFWKGLEEQRVEIQKTDAARALALATSNAAKINAAQEAVFAARLSKEQDLQRRIAALQQGRHGAEEVNKITPNSNLQTEVAERTAKLVTLQKELKDLQQSAATSAATKAASLAKEAAAAAKEAQETAASNQLSSRTWAAENAILAAKGTHHTKLATALERELKLEELKLKLIKEQGLSAADAAAKANQRLNLQDRAEGKRPTDPAAARALKADDAAAKAAATAKAIEKRLADSNISSTERLTLEAAAKRAAAAAARHPRLNPKDAAADLARGNAAADPAHRRREAAADAKKAAAENARKSDDPLIKAVTSISERLSKIAAA